MDSAASRVWRPLPAAKDGAVLQSNLVGMRPYQQCHGALLLPRRFKVYLDTSFFNQLEERFGAPSNFARAYVIAHEVGHHIQHLLGTTDMVDARRGRISEKEMNDLSVRLELQADFLAGVFAHYLKGEARILERGDIEEA